ncbi:Aste57867_6025 [Aphanomyces stellatus]|nr:hypothetical protein As57867_006011 [Aphanomyces stellatus]VFT83038.1 Aste57867_6025 [Aphanomyces stellatus]
MKLFAFALFAFVATAFALKNDAATSDDSQDIVDSGDGDYDEDDAAVDAGAEFFASLDEDEQAAVLAYVADQLNDDDGNDDASAAEVSRGN